MRTKQIEIMRNEEKVLVEIRALKQRENEQLERKFGIKYDFKNRCMVGNVLGYAKEALIQSIVSPEDLKSEESLGDLDKPDYMQLQQAFTDINNPPKKDEKSFLSEQ